MSTPLYRYLRLAYGRTDDEPFREIPGESDGDGPTPKGMKMDEKTAWTPEPWEYEPSDDGDASVGMGGYPASVWAHPPKLEGVVDDPVEIAVMSHPVYRVDSSPGSAVGTVEPFDHGSGNANAARIVQCVNACKGLADPAAHLATLARERDAAIAEVGRLSNVIEREIERCENCLAASTLRVAPEIHVKGLTGCVRNVFDTLAAALASRTATTTTNPGAST